MLRAVLKLQRSATPLRRAFSTPSFATEGERKIYEKLSKALSPEILAVSDVSGGCGSMYRVHIGATAFRGLNLVRQHRKVNEILKDDIAGMHGLQLETFVPQSEEY
ncbi:hypothetical protein IWQ60_009872 [Tieghemiomyces parasiticus]|uniref:Bola-like protein n=1 Tax=Tieghemiomyces parasiticus TaxID=78921 RepID=A0A9W7ZN32_9FUNG|nr:hypothetical protein IWQ60_009872 [Tieghemiomyces parasiticus]